MKTLTKSLLIGGGALGSIGVGAGVATGIILPKALKAKKELEKVAVKAGSDPSKSWAEDKKINLVVLGDSESRGMDYTNTEGVGYGEFLAADLNKSQKLASYKNFSKSGARTLEQIQLISESRAVKASLKNADLVTLTIGANDLLQYVNMFGSAMGKDIEGQRPQGGIDYNQNHSLLKAVRPTNSSETPSEALSEDVIVKNSLNKMIDIEDMYKSGDTSKILTVEGDSDKILDDIKNTFTLLVHQLHRHAPNAKIEILGHAFPFTQWPDSVINTKRQDLGGLSIVEFYDKLLKFMDEGAHKTISGSADYVEFTKIDEISAYKVMPQDTADYNKNFNDYVIGDDKSEMQKSIYNTFQGLLDAKSDQTKVKAAIDNHYANNAFPSATNIHPSAFGYQIIGNGLFSKYSERLGLEKDKTLKNYTFLHENKKGDVGFNPSIIDASKATDFLNKEFGVLSLIDPENQNVKNLTAYFSNPFVEKINEAFKIYRDNLGQDVRILGPKIMPIIDKIKSLSRDKSLPPVLGIDTNNPGSTKNPLEKTVFKSIGTLNQTIFGLCVDNAQTQKMIITSLQASTTKESEKITLSLLLKIATLFN